MGGDSGVTGDCHHTSYEFVLIDDNPDASFLDEVEACWLVCRYCHKVKIHGLPSDELTEEQKRLLREIVGLDI